MKKTIDKKTIKEKTAKTKMTKWGIFAACALAVLTCGCGGKTKTETDASDEKTFVWVATGVGVEEENAEFRGAVLKGDEVYFKTYDWREEFQDSRVLIKKLNLSDGSVSEVLQTGGDGARIQQFLMKEDGSVVALAARVEADEKNYSQTYFLCTYDPDGNLTQETSLPEEDDFYAENICMDAEGRVYLAGSSKIFLFDSEFRPAGRIDVDTNRDWICAIGVSKDGKVCVALQGVGNCVLREIDFDAKKLGETYENFPETNYSQLLGGGLEQDFLVPTQEGVFDYSLEKQEAVKVFDWLDCDINGQYVETATAMEDGRIFAFVRDWDMGTSEVNILEKKEGSQVAQKKELILGTIYTSSDLRAAAVNFNKANDRYHVTIRTYFNENDVDWEAGDSGNYMEVLKDAQNRLSNDIVSDNSPDLIALAQLNVAVYAQKGVFDDLRPYAEASSAIRLDNYFPNVLAAYEYDGKLVCIPRDFRLFSIVGKESLFGDRKGWSMAELMEFGNSHPEAQLVANTPKSYALRIMTQYDQDNYVNWQTGECSFDSENFIKVLEFANRFPDEVDYSEDDRSYPAGLAEGKILLDMVYLHGFESLQLPPALFGEPVTYVGYPNSGGQSGTYLDAVGTTIAVSSKSGDKEGAFAFIEFALTREQGDRYMSAFPADKTAFDEAKEKAMKVEYLLDEDGNQVLDDDGNPIAENPYGTIGYGNGFEYEYHIPTQEEMEVLEQLIEVAVPRCEADEEIMNIITEEAEAYFKGQKSAKEVAGVIQSRVSVYVNENR